jgi:hypothetical protein
MTGTLRQMEAVRHSRLPAEATSVSFCDVSDSIPIGFSNGGVHFQSFEILWCDYIFNSSSLQALIPLFLENMDGEPPMAEILSDVQSMAPTLSGQLPRIF